MKITAVEEYGLRCLIRVAEHDDGDPISAQSVADMEGLSLAYTQKILRILSKAELVDSKRGAHGGYYLHRDAEEISLGDVMRSLGGFFEIDDICERHTGELSVCSNACHCTIRPVWSHISEYVMSTMDGIPLSVLMEDETSVRRHLRAISPPPAEEPQASIEAK